MSRVDAATARRLDEAHNSGPLAIAELGFYERSRTTLARYGEDCLGDALFEAVRSMPTRERRDRACSYLLGRFNATEILSLPAPRHRLIPVFVHLHLDVYRRKSGCTDEEATRLGMLLALLLHHSSVHVTLADGSRSSSLSREWSAPATTVREPGSCAPSQRRSTSRSWALPSLRTRRSQSLCSMIRSRGGRIAARHAGATVSATTHPALSRARMPIRCPSGR